MRHGEILTLIIIPYRFNYPLLIGSWQGQPLVSLHKPKASRFWSASVCLKPFTPLSALAQLQSLQNGNGARAQLAVRRVVSWSQTQYAFFSRMEINAADWIRRELVTTNVLVFTDKVSLGQKVGFR
jgi:hypothetical protein